jgi:hypothetical protein
MAVKDKKFDYDGVFKELLNGFPDEDVVAFINSLFGRNYPRDSKVLRLATESHVDGEEKRSDMLLRVGDGMFHVELQSSNDNSIALRVIEYSFRAAVQHGRSLSGDFLELDFPKSVVFYLRSNKNTPKELTVRLRLPDDSVAAFKIPVRRLNEYTPEELTEASKVVFAPFFPMNFEGENLKSPEQFEKLKTSVDTIIDGIKAKKDESVINQRTADLAVKALEGVLKNVLLHSAFDKKEVEKVMEAVEKKYILEPLNWEEKGIKKGIKIGEARGRKEGEAKGRQEGEARGEHNAKIDTAIKMFLRGQTLEFVKEITELDEELLKRMYEDARSRMNSPPPPPRGMTR